MVAHTKIALTAFVIAFTVHGAEVEQLEVHRDFLQLRIEADDTTIVAGKQVTLRAEIENRNDVPLNLYIGASPGGGVFEKGSAFRMRYISGGTLGEEVRSTPLVGECGNESTPLFREIGRLKKYTATVTAKFREWMSGDTFFVIGSNRAFFIDTPCTVAVWAEHEVGIGDYSSNSFNRSTREWEIPSGPVWVGRMESNTVILRIPFKHRQHTHSN
jgi:hypothetical protein